MSKEALKLALDALINHEGNYKLEKAGAARSLKAITVIKHALEQPVQPVAWLKTIETPGGFGKFVEAKPDEKGAKPVYLTPPAQTAVPLTDEQIADIQTAANLNWVNLNCREHRDAFVRAIEAAHGITKGQP